MELFFEQISWTSWFLYRKVPLVSGFQLYICNLEINYNIAKESK